MKKEFKATCKEFDKEYNIISFRKSKNDYKEFYIEKKGYGNLYYVCGVKEEDFELSREKILHYIKFALCADFWGEN